VGVLVLVACCAVVVPWCFLPAASRWCAGATQAGLLPAVRRPGLVGVDAAEHLVPSCSVHCDVFKRAKRPARWGWLGWPLNARGRLNH
jgi:hypothetical protein